jgi:hypothetical protein
MQLLTWRCSCIKVSMAPGVCDGLLSSTLSLYESPMEGGSDEWELSSSKHRLWIWCIELLLRFIDMTLCEALLLHIQGWLIIDFWISYVIVFCYLKVSISEKVDILVILKSKKDSSWHMHRCTQAHTQLCFTNSRNIIREIVENIQAVMSTTYEYSLVFKYDSHPYAFSFA